MDKTEVKAQFLGLRERIQLAKKKTHITTEDWQASTGSVIPRNTRLTIIRTKEYRGELCAVVREYAYLIPISKMRKL